MNNLENKSVETPAPQEQKKETNSGWDVVEILSEATDLIGGIVGSGIEVVGDAVSLIGE